MQDHYWLRDVSQGKPLSLALPQWPEGQLLPGCRRDCSAEAWGEEGRGSGQSMAFSAAPPRLCSLPTAQNDLFKTASDDWVLLNVNVTGYFQVNYDEDNWRMIQHQLQTNLSVGTCRPTPFPGCCPRLQALPASPA